MIASSRRGSAVDPLAALSPERQNLADYFKESVAVVTNPAIDREREVEHFSCRAVFGHRPGAHTIDPEPRTVETAFPIIVGGHHDLAPLSDVVYREVARAHKTYLLEDLWEEFRARAKVLDVSCLEAETTEGALVRLRAEAAAAVRAGAAIIDLGKAKAILPRSEQAPHERYFVGQHRKVLVLEVRRAIHGPQIIVSRAHKGLVKRLFELEVPEIYHGQVEVMGIAREAGSRTKIAVRSRQPGLDAVGACVGQRGLRVQAISNELGGEGREPLGPPLDVAFLEEEPLALHHVGLGLRHLPHDLGEFLGQGHGAEARVAPLGRLLAAVLEPPVLSRRVLRREHDP